MAMKYADIGSVISGTLKTEDLLEAFADELEYQLSRNKKTRGINKRAKLRLIRDARAVDPDGEGAGDIVDELSDALCEFAPAYVYFGANTGDGAAYGYWPDIDSLECTDDLLKVNDLGDVPNDYRGLVMDVNDHGNVTLYNRTARDTYRELWACV